MEKDDFIFGHRVGKRWTPSGYRSSVNHYLKKAIADKKIDKVRLHRSRHTLAKLLADDGASPYQIKERLGHADLRMGERYVGKGSKMIRDKNKEMINEGMSKRYAAVSG